MWKRHLTFAQAIDMVRVKRGFIDPNIGFVGQLMDFDKKLQSFRLSDKKVN
jgi:hypothetical protein